VRWLGFWFTRCCVALYCVGTGAFKQDRIALYIPIIGCFDLPIAPT